MSASRRRARPVRLLLGVALLGLCAVGVGYPLWWGHRSATVGAVLLAEATAARANSAGCPSTALGAAMPSGGPGVLQVPALKLTAPVLDGLGDNVLNVAVGHSPGTLWPGEPGEALLEAHDVSYFANLDNVRSGAQVVWTTRCMRAVFSVIGTEISHPGATIPAPANGTGLVLVTCYPTNALFWTNQRYVVTTRLVSEVIGPQGVPKTPKVGTKLVVPAPASLVAQGLALDESGNYLALHTLQLAGSPNASWIEGPGPLQVEADALSVLFGAAKAVSHSNAGWWNAITVPGLRRPSAWPFGDELVDITITMHGLVPLQVSVTSSSASATFTVQRDVIRLAQLS